LTDAAAEHMSRCPQLRSVDFSNCPNMTGTASQYVSNCSQLRSVILEDCGNRASVVTVQLAKCGIPQEVGVDLQTDVDATSGRKCCADGCGRRIK
jgi:hypothetical protein